MSSLHAASACGDSKHALADTATSDRINTGATHRYALSSSGDIITTCELRKMMISYKYVIVKTRGT